MALLSRRSLMAAAAAVSLASAGSPAVVSARQGRQSDEKAVGTIAPSLARVQVGGPDGPVVTCSGIVVHPDGYVVTAGACLDLLRAGGSAPGLEVVVDVAEGTPTGAPTAARLVELEADARAGLALLRVNHHDLPTAPVVRRDPAAGVELVFGFLPASIADVGRGADGTFFPGSVRGVRDGLLETGGTLSDGMRGGPVFDLEGRVLGLVVAAEADDVLLLAPASAVRRLLARNRVEPHPGPAGVAYQEGLRRLSEGAYDEAEEKMTEALDRNGRLESARRVLALLAEIEQIRELEGDDTPVGAYAWAAAMALLVLVLAVGLVARQSGRRSLPARKTSSPPAG